MPIRLAMTIALILCGPPGGVAPTGEAAEPHRPDAVPQAETAGLWDSHGPSTFADPRPIAAERPERFVRSRAADERVEATAAPLDESRRSLVVTADAIREIPGGRNIAPTDLDGTPQAPPVATAASTLPPSAEPAAGEADGDHGQSLAVAGCLAGLALLIGLWLRMRQARQNRPLSKPLSVPLADLPLVRFEPRAAAPENPLEALIRNELALVEEPVEFPPRLEFHGWPAGVPALRLDASHARPDLPAGGAPLAGPHFLRRRTARVRASVKPDISESARPAREPSPQREEAAAAPGPLERALQRLSRNQT
ncbi:MAG TPA: hypothetical protein VML55_13750 [Planctomycetaceae bacterium]|nr:hypothetical protein [Planctomycetaceae bacterium]